MSDALLSETGSATSSLIAFQAFSRLLTFALNAIIVRKSAPSLLGLVARFELIAGTVGVICREGMRVALLRSPKYDAKDASDKSESKGKMNHNENQVWTRQFINMTWVGVAISAIVIITLNVGFRFWWISEEFKSQSIHSTQIYHSILTGYSISALIEVASDSAGLLLLYHRKFSERIQAESFSLILKTLLIFWRIAGTNNADLLSLLPIFPIAQLVFSASLAFFLTWKAQRIGLISRFIDIFPSIPFVIDAQTLPFYFSLLRHAILKFAITQGDQWIMTIISTAHTQGIYATVANYGSLVCRVLLQPIEEASLSLFSRSFTSKDQAQAQAAINYLSIILRFDIYLSMAAVSFGPPFAALLVSSVFGKGWSGGEMSSALSAYCLLIPAMAFCGILESFIHGTIKSDQLLTYQRISLTISIQYLLLAAIFVTRWKAVGLIAANLFAFAARAIYGIFYLLIFLNANGQGTSLPRKSVLPQRIIWIVVGVSACVNYASWATTHSSIDHFFVGLTSSIICVMTVAQYDRAFLLQLFKIFVSKGKRI